MRADNVFSHSGVPELCALIRDVPCHQHVTCEARQIVDKYQLMKVGQGLSMPTLARALGAHTARACLCSACLYVRVWSDGDACRQQQEVHPYHFRCSHDVPDVRSSQGALLYCASRSFVVGLVRELGVGTPRFNFDWMGVPNPLQLGSSGLSVPRRMSINTEEGMMLQFSRSMRLLQRLSLERLAMVEMDKCDPRRLVLLFTSSGV